MELHLQESRRGGAVAAVTREGQPPVLFEGDTILSIWIIRSG